MCIRERNVRPIVKYLFQVNLTPTQCLIVRKIAYTESKRVAISAMTRYGKSFCVAIGVALYILFNEDKRIAIVAPKYDQAEILRNYLARLIIVCPELQALAHLDREHGAERLAQEATKKRLTFRNGCEYAIFSAEGDADRLMGFGANLLVIDEACLISREARVKVNRMLGDDPRYGVLVELFNPWETDNQAFDDWNSPRFEKLHIGWEVALKEGRTTLEFIEEQREHLPPMAFQVLYESRFPDQSEHGIFSLAWVLAAMERKESIWADLLRLRKAFELKRASGASEFELNVVRKLLMEYKVIVCCDPADKGLDKTVTYWGCWHGSKYEVAGWHSEATSDNQRIARRLFDLAQEYQADRIHIDGHGLGVGVVSRLRELKAEHNTAWKVVSCLFGEAAGKKEFYANRKAEEYFRLRDILKNGLIRLPPIQELKAELMKMEWDRKGRQTILIIDPEDKSPDWADALVYFTWQDSHELIYDFLG